MPTASAARPDALPAEARAAVLRWFDANGRSFPFRGLTDPYAILVSETMAQQTQIARATERWVPFLARFPTADALAAAPVADVLREWRGLGYNRRAINLWRAARAIVRDHGGRVPDDLVALQRLPGVGPYTARAVAALAFGRRVGAVDTNVRRVLGRVLGGVRGLSPRDLQLAADAAVAPERPGDWTHAMMDLGALVCRAARPSCVACPLRAWCRYAGESPDGVMAPPRRRARNGTRPFEATSRWLRGRVLDRLRDAPADAWVRLEPPIGDHDAAAVETALVALARDGLVERDPADPAICRLPT